MSATALKQKDAAYFDNQLQAQEVLTFSAGGLSFKIQKQELRRLAHLPFLFLFDSKDNLWVRDIIHQIEAQRVDWCEDNPAELKSGYLQLADNRITLYEHLHYQPLMRRSNDVAPCIITIGNEASAEVARWRRAFNRLDAPQLFCVTSDPTILELVDLHGRFLENTNGVWSVPARSFEKQVSTLKSVHGNLSSVLIVSGEVSCFDLARGEHEQTVARMSAECRRQKLRATHVSIDSQFDFEKNWSVLAQRHQAMITLNDKEVHVQIPAIKKFCAKHKILFLASDLSSVMHGAALGFGCSPQSYAAAIIGLIAEQSHNRHKRFDQLEMAAMEDAAQMRHNIHNIKEQMRRIPRDKLNLLELLSIYARY